MTYKLHKSEGVHPPLGVAAGHLRSLRERSMVVHVHLIHSEMENVSMMYRIRWCVLEHSGRRPFWARDRDIELAI